jgi:hypothetical protein
MADPNNINVNTEPLDPATLGPDMFFSDVTVPDPTTQLNAPLPRAWSEGGIIEAVKRSVITGLREAFTGSAVDAVPGKFYIDIEYPLDRQSLPGIWVQFSIDNLQRGGLNMGTWTKDTDGNWGEIRTWIFNGKITLTCAALSSKDRDRLSDTIIAQLSFARPPDLVIRDAGKDAQQFRALITALNDNPFVSMTLNTDQVLSGGQTVTNAVPWASNELLYEDNYSIGCHGQFNIRYNFDGVFELAEIDYSPTLMAEGVAYNPIQWRGKPPAR